MVGFNKKTIEDIDLDGKTVLLRADYNVPVKNGKITDAYRVEQSVPTVQYLLGKNCKIVICSHLGRPEGKPSPKYSLKPVAKKLEQLLKHDVAMAGDCIGPEVQQAVQALKPKQILLLENLRFHPEEEKNDNDFAKQLAGLAEVFVQDGFGVVHRAHASTEAVTHFLPSVAGLLLAKEVGTINQVMDDPKLPLMAIIGGAKIADKIEILKRFIQKADVVAVGGAMANTFLAAQRIDVGKSLYDKSEIDLADDIIDLAKEESQKRHFVFYLPQDAVVATSLDKTAHTRIVDFDAHVIAQIENYPHLPNRKTGEVGDRELILDIGPFSGAFIAGAMQLVNTVVWNGAMGVTETPAVHGPVGPFAHGTELIVEAMLGDFGHRPFTLAGGGDTVGYIESRKLTGEFNHVSTGGGASMELMSGKKLPGVEALQDK